MRLPQSLSEPKYPPDADARLHAFRFITYLERFFQSVISPPACFVDRSCPETHRMLRSTASQAETNTVCFHDGPSTSPKRLVRRCLQPQTFASPAQSGLATPPRPPNTRTFANKLQPGSCPTHRLSFPPFSERESAPSSTRPRRAACLRS